MTEPEDALRLAERIKPLLAGHHPMVQGAALAELLSLWVMGHHPEKIREALLQAHIDTVRELISAASPTE